MNDKEWDAGKLLTKDLEVGHQSAQVYGASAPLVACSLVCDESRVPSPMFWTFQECVTVVSSLPVSNNAGNSTPLYTC